jgi:mono/diheme cytochrome c family protein
MLIGAMCSGNATLAGGAAQADAKATFGSKCASCHGLNGAGTTAKGKEMKLKDMRSAEVQGMTDDELFKIIAKGKGKMPGYEKSLGADMCHKLVAYIRTLKQ